MRTGRDAPVIPQVEAPSANDGRQRAVEPLEPFYVGVAVAHENTLMLSGHRTRLVRGTWISLVEAGDVGLARPSQRSIRPKRRT